MFYKKVRKIPCRFFSVFGIFFGFGCLFAWGVSKHQKLFFFKKIKKSPKKGHPRTLPNYVGVFLGFSSAPWPRLYRLWSSNLGPLP
jgi:hypothetical protein